MRITLLSPTGEPASGQTLHDVKAHVDSPENIALVEVEGQGEEWENATRLMNEPEEFMIVSSASPTVINEIKVGVGKQIVLLTNAGIQMTQIRKDVAQLGLLTTTVGVLSELFDSVVDTYVTAVDELEDQVDELEDAVFDQAPEVAESLHEQLRAVLRLQRHIHHLNMHTQRYTRRITDPAHERMRQVNERVAGLAAHMGSLREVISSAMQVHLSLVGQRQNNEMERVSKATFEQGEQSKKVASWAAILFTPTVIAGIYGMNFHHMPELATRYGYPTALLLMGVAAATLFVVFKRQEWL